MSGNAFASVLLSTVPVYIHILLKCLYLCLFPLTKMDFPFLSFLFHFIMMQRSLTRSSIVRNEWCVVSFFGADNLIISFNCVWIAQATVRKWNFEMPCHSRAVNVQQRIQSAFFSVDHSREQTKMTAKPLYNFIINYIILTSFSGDMLWPIHSGNSSNKKKKKNAHLLS